MAHVYPRGLLDVMPPLDEPKVRESMRMRAMAGSVTRQPCSPWTEGTAGGSRRAKQLDWQGVDCRPECGALCVLGRK